MDTGYRSPDVFTISVALSALKVVRGRFDRWADRTRAIIGALDAEVLGPFAEGLRGSLRVVGVAPADIAEFDRALGLAKAPACIGAIDAIERRFVGLADNTATLLKADARHVRQACGTDRRLAAAAARRTSTDLISALRSLARTMDGLDLAPEK